MVVGHIHYLVHISDGIWMFPQVYTDLSLKYILYRLIQQIKTNLMLSLKQRHGY